MSVLVPVAAFAAAFVIGEATKPTVHNPPHLAPALNVSDGTVTVTGVARVPDPPRLVLKPRTHKPAKPPTTAGFGGVALRPAIRDAPLYTPVVERPPTASQTASASGTATAPVPVAKTPTGRTDGAAGGTGGGGGGASGTPLTTTSTSSTTASATTSTPSPGSGG